METRQCGNKASAAAGHVCNSVVFMALFRLRVRRCGVRLHGSSSQWKVLNLNAAISLNECVSGESKVVLQRVALPKYMQLVALPCGLAEWWS